MLQAAKKGDLELVKKIINDQGPQSLQVVDDFGQTPIHIAAFEGHFAVLSVLLENGAKVNDKDKNSWTPLHSATFSGRLEICEELLKWKADPNSTTAGGTTPFHYLVGKGGHSEESEKFSLVFHKMLETGGDLNQQNELGETPLHLSCFHGRKKVTKLILEHHPQLDLRTKFGETALHYAARGGSLEIVRLLLEEGMDANVIGDSGTPSDVAEASNHMEIKSFIELKTKASATRGSQDLGMRTEVKDAYGLEIGPAGMPPRQRRLRHLKSISARNLRSVYGRQLLNSFFTLHDCDEADSQPIFTSEVAQQTTNPNWRPLENENHPCKLVSSTHLNFVVRLWECTNQTNVLIADSKVNLCRLGYVGELTSIFFPSNTVILELTDGFYVTSSTIAILREKGLTGRFVSKTDSDKRARQTGNTYSAPTLQSLVKLKWLLKEKSKERDLLKAAVDTQIETHRGHLTRLRTHSTLKNHIESLKREIETKTKNLEEERKRVIEARKNDLLPRCYSLAEAQVALLASRQQLAKEKEELHKDRTEYDTVCQTLQLSRWNLIHQLKFIYPIQQLPEGSIFSIASIKLPNSDFNGCDEEQIATALGYTCHAIYLISKWLEVPLRYPMVPMCSRSTISDEISQQSYPKFPLYSRGVDRTRFEYGVFLLNKNLEQLLGSQGVEIVSLRCTLPNLAKLIDHALLVVSSSYLGSSAIQTSSNGSRINSMTRDMAFSYSLKFAEGYHPLNSPFPSSPPPYGSGSPYMPHTRGESAGQRLSMPDAHHHHLASRSLPVLNHGIRNSPPSSSSPSPSSSLVNSIMSQEQGSTKGFLPLTTSAPVNLNGPSPTGNNTSLLSSSSSTTAPQAIPSSSSSAASSSSSLKLGTDEFVLL